MVIKAEGQGESFACFVDPEAEGAVSGLRGVGEFDTAFRGVIFEPLEGVFVHGRARRHTEILTVSGVGLG